MPPKESTQAERRAHWQSLINQQQQSTESIRAFCRRLEIPEHVFYSWRARLRQASEPLRFALVEAKTKSSPNQSPMPIEIVLTSGDRVHIPAEATALRLVLGLLRERERV